MGLITITEANGSLNDEVFPEWDALDDPFKQRHINRMSSYIVLNWTHLTATDFDWTDDTTWPATTKDVLAEYADADRSNLIYDEAVPGEESDSPIKKKKQKVGSLETEVEYATELGSSGTDLAALDDMLLALGYSKLASTGFLTRT